MRRHNGTTANALSTLVNHFKGRRMLRRALACQLSLVNIAIHRVVRRAKRNILSLTTSRIRVHRNRLHFSIVKAVYNNFTCLTRIDNHQAHRRRHLHTLPHNRHIVKIHLRRLLMNHNNANMVTLHHGLIHFLVLKQRRINADHHAYTIANADAIAINQIQITKVQHDAIRTKLHNRQG